MQLVKGQRAPLFITKDIWGHTIDLAQIKNRKTLLSFFRYAECAVCQLRMIEIMREKEKFREQNIEVITIFQSPEESLKANIVDKIHFDFTIIADPKRVLYNLYSVKPSWLKMIATINFKGIERVFNSMKEGFKPGGKIEGHFHQIPADFIIGGNGEILIAKYGKNVIDHIPLHEILSEL